MVGLEIVSKRLTVLLQIIGAAMNEDDTFRRLKRTPFPELREIVNKKARDLNSLLLVLQQNSWTTAEWKEACLEESARIRPPLQVVPPKPPKSKDPIPTNYVHRKDSQFAPKIGNISEYMRNLTITKG